MSRRFSTNSCFPRSTSPPAFLRVRFIKAEGEECLGDYSKNVLSVDPLSQLDAIGNYLCPVVKKSGSGPPAVMFEEENLPIQLSADSVLGREKSPAALKEICHMSSGSPEMQV